MKQVRFKHITGSRKHILGVSQSDQEPRMISVPQFNPQINQTMNVLHRDETHVVKVNLAAVDKSVVALTDLEKDLPATVQERILERRADEFERLTQYNEDFLKRLRGFEARGEIEILEIVEVDPNEVEAEAQNLDLSEIAYADYTDRGIAIPEAIARANADKIAAWDAARAQPVAPMSKPSKAAPKAPKEPVIEDDAK